jgi:hypothetical protein
MPGVNTIQRLHNEASIGTLNTRTMLKLRTTGINALPIPRHRHSMNVSILSFTPYPGTTIRYRYISEINPLEVIMKRPSWNPKMKQDHLDLLMKPQTHPKHEGIRLLGVTYQEDSTSGTGGQGVLTMKNNPEMKRTFWNEVTTRMKIRNEAVVRMMVRTIW